MSIGNIINRRDIKEILHFTTNIGLLGILASRGVLSRERLPQEKYLEHVYTPNCRVRRDTQWLDYVNMSISSINANLFDIASENWHKNRDVWWCILAFDPEIITHQGVVFTTTNNMYSNVMRDSGEAGLENLFKPLVATCNRTSIIQLQRPHDLAAQYPTCPQAEVLYPGMVPIDYLRRIYVSKHDFEFAIFGQCAALNLAPVEISVDPSIFKGIRG